MLKTYRYIFYVVGGFSGIIAVSSSYFIWQKKKTDLSVNNAITTSNKHKKTSDNIVITLEDLEELFEAGNSEYKKGNNARAIGYYRKALTSTPLIIDLLLKLGQAYAKLEKHDQAIATHRTILAIRPRYIISYLLLARSLHAQQQTDEALNSLNMALALDSKNHNTHIEIAKILMDQKNYEKALVHVNKAQKLAPKNVHGYLTHGHILNWKGDITGAIDMYRKATEIDPKCANAHYNLGHTLKVYGKMHEAIISLKMADDLDTDHIDTHIALSHAYWALGDFEKAWHEYEWRWKQYKQNSYISKITPWNGKSPLKDKIILLYSEQGLGDTMQFIRYAQELKKQGATIWCKVQKPLTKLLSLCPYIDRIIETDQLSNLCHQIDFQAPLMSLPGVLKTTPDTIPATIPYLYSDNALCTNWKDYLAKDKNLKIGICWYVEQQHEIYKLPIAHRSLSLEHFKTLSQCNHVNLYCLQRSDDKHLKNIPSDIKLHFFSSDFDVSHGSFMDSAAVISHLDLVITVDTCIAHLAGALGKKVWMLLPYSSDCRWYLQPDSSPWYPTMRIFRQPEPGNWKTVMNNILAELEQLRNTTHA